MSDNNVILLFYLISNFIVNIGLAIGAICLKEFILGYKQEYPFKNLKIKSVWQVIATFLFGLTWILAILSMFFLGIMVFVVMPIIILSCIAFVACSYWYSFENVEGIIILQLSFAIFNISSLFSGLQVMAAWNYLQALTFITFYYFGYKIFGDYLFHAWYHPHVGAVEVSEIPDSYLDWENMNHDPKFLYLDFLESIVENKMDCAYVLSFEEGKMSILFLMRSSNRRKLMDNLLSLKGLLQYRFKDFKFTITMENLPKIPAEMNAYNMTYMPKPSSFGKTNLTDYLIENKFSGIFYLLLRPVKIPKRFVLKIKKIFESYGSRTSLTPMQIKNYNRIRMMHLRCKRNYRNLTFGAYLVCSTGSNKIDTTLSKRIYQQFIDMYSGYNWEVKGKKISKSKLVNLDIQKVHFPKTSICTPEDILPYLCIPPVDIGIPVVHRLKGHLPTLIPDPNSKMVKGKKFRFGTIVRWEQGARHDLPFEFFVNTLTHHGAIFGKTGSGKTVLVKTLLLKLYQNEVNFLIIEPAKTEYRDLITKIPGIHVFIPGNERVPYRINFLTVPPYTSVSKHVGILLSIFRAGFELPLFCIEILELSLISLYEKHGFDVAKDIRPTKQEDQIILPEELYYEVIRQMRNRYSPERQKDIRDALLLRLKSLLSGSRGLIFNCKHSIPVKNLLNGHVLLDLTEFGDVEQKRFFTVLLLKFIHAYLEGHGQSSLNSCIFIEEASELFKVQQKQFTDLDATLEAENIINNLMSRARSLGVGIWIVDQHPLKLPERILSEPHTLILKKLDDLEMVETLSQKFNLPKEHALQVPSLKLAMSIIKSPSYVNPILINLPLSYNPQNLKTEMIAEFMADEFFYYHPEYKTAVPPRLTNQDLLPQPSLSSVPMLPYQQEQISPRVNGVNEPHAAFLPDRSKPFLVNNTLLDNKIARRVSSAEFKKKFANAIRKSLENDVDLQVFLDLFKSEARAFLQKGRDLWDLVFRFFIMTATYRFPELEPKEAQEVLSRWISEFLVDARAEELQNV